MSFVDHRQKCVRLGSGSVAVDYPPALDDWFKDLTTFLDDRFADSKWVRLRANGAPDRYDVFASTGTPDTGLDVGEALATFWERVTILLINDLGDSMVLHAAALCHDTGLVLLPGRSGSGKTRLSMWYRNHGFELGTDEIVGASIEGCGKSDVILNGVLTRPLILKSLTDASGLLRPDETPLAQQASPYGLMLKLQGKRAWPQRAFDHGLIVFPRFSAGSPFNLTMLTPGEASLRLLDSCLNVRNLPRGGLAVVGDLACRVPAVSLEYGATAQLDRTLDVFTRQVLASAPSFDDLTDLCEVFTARAAVRDGLKRHDNAFAQPASSVAEPVIPLPSVQRYPRRLTVGMATFDDYDGVYFTIQALRVNNPQLAGDLEFVVVDNNPGGPCSEALSTLGQWIDGYRYIPRGEWSGTAIRNAVFEEASSPFVLCVDSHVLIFPGALPKLIDYFEANPNSCDLIQGPMLHDDVCKMATHMEPKWRGGMYGVWAEDPRGAAPDAPGFDIPMQGLGLFACRRTAWVRFNDKFRGFGGEEGYIHEKTRRYGGRTRCFPFLRWIHRFSRPLGLPYGNRWEDRIRNYLIGFTELELDTAEMEAHFAELLGTEISARIFTETKSGLESAALISRRH